MRALKPVIIMNKFKVYFFLIITTLTLFSCQKDDPVAVVPPQEYSVQYPKDIEVIEEYLSEYYITVTNSPGVTEDQDIVFTKITDVATQPSIKSYELNSGDTYPQLKNRIVTLHNVPYIIYYLVLRPGSKNATTNKGGETPTNTDSVLTSYSGSYLKQTTTDNVTTVSATAFEEVKYPSSFFSLLGVIRGWSEIFPQFKTGSYLSNNNGTISYTDFGAGVMFIPSGLAYYNSPAGSIPSYSPLVFSFKLYEISRDDTDGDGVANYLEDLKDINGYKDNYMYSFRNTILYPTFPEDVIRYADDTDKDGIPNYLDADDDGDNYTTVYEISKGTNYLDASSHP